MFTSGKVYVQDASAKLAAMAAGVQPGMRVLDTCAAPGGKSFALAMQMQNEGSVTSCDIHAHKISLIEKGAARLGISIITAARGGRIRIPGGICRRL
ncbi:MAG: SAM-dependent methyltransferase [Oscillospiraceae bacterium]